MSGLEFRRMGVVLLFAALAVAGCSEDERIVFIEDESCPNSEQPPHNYFLQDAVVTLERTACFGSCPVYTVSVCGDGTVRYEGRRYVAEEGVREAEIPVDDFVELLERVYHIGFFDLKNDYSTVREIRVYDGNRVMGMFSDLIDTPDRIITVKILGYEKRILDHYGTPQEVRDLAAMIDEVARTQPWVEGE